MTKTSRINLRLDDRLAKDLDVEVERERRPHSAVVRDLLEEALRMRRCPGIAFLDGPTGRRAVMAGTGLDVWEVVHAFRGECALSFAELQKAFPGLTPQQLRSALAYAEMFPDDVEARIRRHEQLDEASAHREYPYLRPTGQYNEP